MIFGKLSVGVMSTQEIVHEGKNMPLEKMSIHGVVHSGNFLSWKYAAQKMKFSIKDFFSKCNQIRRFLWIRSHLLKKSLIGKFHYDHYEKLFVKSA